MQVLFNRKVITLSRTISASFSSSAFCNSSLGKVPGDVGVLKDALTLSSDSFLVGLLILLVADPSIPFNRPGLRFIPPIELMRSISSLLNLKAEGIVVGGDNEVARRLVLNPGGGAERTASILLDVARGTKLRLEK